ncbi:4-(cytidine 5'-diphospho)-2-C-methyl-D-erythritol kinase [Novosphingobium jiangmenense]|uniref:4-diphosphocytidyl-2-C-methyl-D-erythritol kinase n=1 Tax=Novosphingobium jiangmenense TaxID=2791981 RepID=A0ABS0HGM9_9SPHN|nr:4-(cytidine 5'-diphospho)-2-C-methyl-D-erythritol kinase [Novosphingobium jiangmenense]MBF9151417.1 4-(cytidine 5'-diphospho)-2-C-methyl-D-erythritol kinase [Novosphingobium jiangmenense]
MRETAYAKINLALHVRRRRGDGYHELETLFAFVDAGDELSASPAQADSLRVVGEFGGALDDPFGNIVAKALHSLPHGPGWAVTLEKNLPVAAGLGGGSADAGAIFRMVRDSHGLPEDWHARAAKLGADVPACVESVACIGRGTGTELDPIANDLAGTPVLLVNPRIPLATGPVFKTWDGVDRGALEGENLRDMTLRGRNDLEAPALSLVPEIGAVLAALGRTGAWLTRMSGSGATCFALYDTPDQRDAALAAMPAGWWTLAGALR